MWAAVGQWVVTSILIPLLQKLAAAYFKSLEKAKKLKDKIQKNKKATDEYTKEPSDDNFSNLP